MARRLDWDKAGKAKRVRRQGAVRAVPEVSGVNYPRPLEPSEGSLRAIRKKRNPGTSEPAESLQAKGKRYRVVSIDSRPSARQAALEQSREAGELRDPGWAKPKKKRKR